MNPIRSHILAGKLADLRRRDDWPALQSAHPRLVEMLWFLQAQSRLPGGLVALANRLVDEFPERFIASAPDTLPWLAEIRESEGIETPLDDGKELARTGLGSLFHDWCEAKTYHAIPCPRYCPTLETLLIEFMDQVEGKVRQTVASTAIARTVYRELEFAITQTVPVPIIGESRFGKTTAVAAWCEMRPGRARLVTVPNTNRERDFIEAHADAFGIEYTAGTSVSRLKELVQFVLRHSGLFLVYDEAHALVPTNYTRNTPPNRLNWVRCEVIDRGLGCAFFATPQSYHQTLAQYTATTGYKMEQWLGRIGRPVVLPEFIGPEDLLAVARNNFPDVSDVLLELTCSRAMRTGSPLQTIELLARRARFLASEAGRSGVSLDDIQEASRYVGLLKEEPAATPSPDLGEAPATPSRRGGQVRSRRAVRPAGDITQPPAMVPARGMQPAEMIAVG